MKTSEVGRLGARRSVAAVIVLFALGIGAVRLEADDASAHFKLGRTLLNKCDFDAAITEFHEAIRLNPRYAQAHINLADALKRKNDWAGMVREYREIVRLMPNQAGAHGGLGEAIERKGDFRAAVDEYRKAAKLDPKDPTYRNNSERLEKQLRRTTMEQLAIFLMVVVILFGLGTILSGFFTVPTAKAAVVQRFGKFVRVAGPGLNFKLPWLEKVAAKVDLRVQQLDVRMETKTKDNVFVQIPVSVQFHVLPERVDDAFYKLSNPREQIGSYVFNVILGHVPKMNLDEAFERQSDIAVAVKQELDGVMAGFGYGIVKALVTDIIPDPKVKAAMNDINAARREQDAANARGEAEKILKVKQAEAEAQSKQLQGQGIANQRKAIIDGLRESVELFKSGVEGATAKDVMTLVLMTQYFDTLKDIGAAAHSNTILMPHTPGSLSDYYDQIRNAIILGGAVTGAKPAAAAAG